MPENFFNELLAFAFSVFTNKTSSREVLQWLNTHQYKVQYYIVALTMVKHYSLSPKICESEMKLFLETFQQEISDKLSDSHRFLNPNDSFIYSKLMAQFGINPQTESSKRYEACLEAFNSFLVSPKQDTFHAEIDKEILALGGPK